MEKSVKITLIISICFLLSVAVLSFAIFGGINVSGKTITSEGVSTIKAIPDIVSIYFNVETEAETSEEASRLNSEIVDELKENLISQGFDENKIQTENFNVRERYDWKDGERVDKGFVASHSIKVEMNANEHEKIGKAIDAGISAGAGVNYINFELTQEKQNEYKAEAMKLAAQDAKIKAEATASGLDMEIGDLVSVSISNYGYYPWRAYSSSGMAVDAEYAKQEMTSITPSEQEISATVSAVFELK